jgi:thiamine-monophosphate kinase
MVATNSASPSDLRRLSDLGERRILSEVIESWFPPAPSALVRIGDDAAALQLPAMDQALVLTTDPCPLPVAWLLGERDFQIFGWYSILISASDLAAMGAKPQGILLAVEAPSDMLIADFERFLEGARQASEAFACPVVGGNLKEGPSFSSVATAVGTCAPEKLLRRSGASPGERVAVIGSSGVFAAAVLARIHQISLPPDSTATLSNALSKPRALVREGQLLSSLGLASSCMDASDGVPTCLFEIARRSDLDIYLDLDSVTVPAPVREVAQHLGVDIRKLQMMWGDWQLVCTVPEGKWQTLEGSLGQLGTPVATIGRTIRGTGSVFLRESGSYRPLRRIDNERFSSSSYLSRPLASVFDLSSFDLFG